LFFFCSNPAQRRKNARREQKKTVAMPETPWKQSGRRVLRSLAARAEEAMNAKLKRIERTGAKLLRLARDAFGTAIRDTSPIRMAARGKWRGIPIGYGRERRI